MIKIKNGIELSSLPVMGLERVQDLDYYDGPLLTHFRHRRQGDHYLYYWCDCTGSVNRWMLLRVSETNIIRLENRVVPLDFVIPKACQDDFVYFIDIGDKGSHAKVTLAQLEAIPNEYKPVQGAYLSAHIVKEERLPKSYSILIESALSISDLSNLPSVFSQAYALLYNVFILRTPRFGGYPWRGGFSAMHFYRWLLDRIPGEDRPSVATLQYASPGFIRFSLVPSIANQVGDLVTSIIGDNVTVNSYRQLSGYIRENKLNEITHGESSDWGKHNEQLVILTRALLHDLRISDAENFIAAAPRPIEAAKIVLSFVRRIKKLAQWDEDGLVRFPASPGHHVKD